MSRFRWRLFWTLALLNVLAVSAVLVFSSRWPDGWPADWRDYVPDLRQCVADLLDHHGREDGTAVLYDADGTFGTYAAAERFAQLFERVVVVTPRDRIAEDCGRGRCRGAGGRTYRRYHCSRRRPA